MRAPGKTQPSSSDSPAARRILLISYHLPPATAVGGLRAANFAKCLPALGYEPTVLTLEENEEVNGCAQADRLPDSIKIIRVKGLPRASQAIVKLKRLAGPLFNSPRPAPAGEEIISEVKSVNADNGRQEMPGIKRIVQSLFLFLPDSEKNWIIPASLAAVREVRRHKIDYIMTTCPPYSVHLVGLLTRLLTGAKWIADYRDPWIIFGYKRLFAYSPISVRIERWIEGKVISHADAVSFNVKRLRDKYSSHYPSQPDDKFIYIPNGFDPEYFSTLRKMEKYEKFTLTYAGSLYLGRTPEPVFKAVRKLIDKGIVCNDSIRIKLVGNCGSVNGIKTAKLASSYGLDSMVEVSGTVPYQKAMNIIRKSHIALLFAPDQSYQVPGKVYDYIGAGTEILALTDEGATSDFISSTNAGSVFGPEDIDGIAGFIKNRVSEKTASSRKALDDHPELHIKAITEKLADRLNAI
jgi:glycosyltransferase involved in cell wall biosynthesis